MPLAAGSAAGIITKLKFKHFFHTQFIDSSTAACAVGMSVDEQDRRLNRRIIKWLFTEGRQLIDQ
jgi:hypothetical protein